ncbi:MAG: putative 4-hydroxybenzoate polyprenyltransferase [Planctomycetales bacterium]|nr:putative 4-hydroxybenzoate polyprenyltransferase [Planctomycetales bacterium]
MTRDNPRFRLRAILEMIRFSHTIFALPFALLAAVMAWTMPAPVAFSDASALGGSSVGAASFGWRPLVGILVCMVAARSAAMSFNRIVDRRLDATNPRTKNRHLVTGELTVAQVGLFTLAACVLFILGTLLFLPNWWPIALSVPVLAFICGYSLAKRFTWLVHFWLGASLMLAPVCTWIALRGEWLLGAPSDLIPAIALGVSILLWVAGFDIIYACQDTEHDRQSKLHSIPSRFGVTTALRLSAVLHAMMIGVLATLPWLAPTASLGWLYGIGLGAVALLLVYEHLLVSPSDLTRVNAAFFQVNALVSIGLFVIVTVDLLW